MNPYTGATYPTIDDALDQGEDSEDLVEISGPQGAVEQAINSVRQQAKAKARRRERNKVARQTRKRNAC